MPRVEDLEFIFLYNGFPRRSKISPPEAAVEDDEEVVLRERLGGTSELWRRVALESFAFLSLQALIRR